MRYVKLTGIAAASGLLAIAAASAGASAPSGSTKGQGDRARGSSSSAVLVASSHSKGHLHSGQGHGHGHHGAAGLEEPTGVTATPGDTVVTLSWIPPVASTVTVTGYQVQESTDGTTWTTVADQIATLTTQVTGLTNGTTYLFKVAAEATTTVGEFSHPVSAFPSATPTVATAPGPVSSAVAESSDEGGSMTELHWSSPSSDGGSPVTGYQLQISTDGGATWTVLADGVMDNHFKTPRVANAVYEVAAENAIGIGPGTQFTIEAAESEGGHVWSGEGDHGGTTGSSGTTGSTGTTGAAGSTGTSGSWSDGSGKSHGGLHSHG